MDTVLKTLKRNSTTTIVGFGQQPLANGPNLEWPSFSSTSTSTVDDPVEDVSEIENRIWALIIRNVIRIYRELFKCSSRRHSEYCANERKVWRLAGKMLVNSSVLDNEFFESDIPFELNAAALRHPMKWFSSNKRLFLPRYFSDSCLRYMLTFLAQYGRKWLEDSHTFMAKPEMENGFLTGNFLQLATLLASENSSNLPKHEKNWGRTWSRILKSREESMSYVTDEISEQLQMPFGFKSGKAIETDHEYSAWSSDDDRLRLFGISFKRYESKIKRLIDSLPPGLFEKDDPKGVEIIQNICSLDLENFLLFLQINPVEPLDTVKCTKLTSSVADDGGEHMETKEDCSMNGNVITSRSLPNPYVTATRAKTRNFVLLGEKIGPHFHRIPSTCIETEFMLHLENLSAISHRIFINAIHSEKIDWDAYLKQFGLHRSVSRFFKTRNYIPKCVSQLRYWDRFGLPECIPPALGARRLITHRPNVDGIRFIGYVVEIVRTRLAKWTASAQASELHRGSWTTKIPQEWSMAFRARSDLSILCREFEEQKDVLHISIQPEQGRSLSRDDLLQRNLKWTCSEQVLWECQKHILELISDDQREYGPQNVELILLFLLGFPMLNVQDLGGVNRLTRIVVDSQLTVEASLIGKSPNDVRIEIRIRTHRDYPALESGDPVQFRWKDWIHEFEGCMKVLSMNFEWNDLKKRRTIEKPFALSSDEYTEGEGCSGSDYTWNSFEVMGESKSGESEHVEDQDNNRDGIEDRGDGGWGSNDKVGEEKRADMAHSLKDDDANCICANARGKADENENGGKVATASAEGSECEDQIWKKKENGGDDSISNEHTLDSSESERGGDDGSDLGVGAADRMDEPETMSSTSTTTSTGYVRRLTMSSTSTTTSTGSPWVPWHRRCACEYGLDQRAEKRIIEGTNEYYWHWEGWKPQPAFQRHPLVFELEGCDIENGTSAEEKDAVDVESTSLATWGEEAEEAVWEEDGNEEESGVEMV
ncbi:hypothetical protein FGB62_10g15 [Gracilaria domingensis]|nr:hypothetical protein FGB62_10g15 [Gracilaria domingensis]